MAKFITEKLTTVIAQKSLPGITLWNRLEGRPRAEKFERALRAEVRDPLWMLARQWQMGEFRGDDAGSPIFAKVRVETTHVHKYRPANGPVEPFTTEIPLEAHVERMPVPLFQGTHEIALDIRLLMGRQWLKMVQALAPAARAQFITAYRVHTPNPLDPADAPTCAHPQAWSSFAATAVRAMDGAKLYTYLKTDPGHHAFDGIAALAGLEIETDTLAERFVAWVERLFYQPGERSAWEGDRLEYQFACAAPEQQDEKVLTAEEYFHGHLDWYNFDVDPNLTVLGEPDAAAEEPQRATLTMLPTQVTFNGMPNTRW